MIIDDEAVIIHHKSSSERILKNAIKDVKVYDDIIIIYLSSITAIIIPTRYLDKDLVDDFIKKVHKRQISKNIIIYNLNKILYI